MCHVSHVTRHVSHVTCHMSYVTCHMSHVTCHLPCVTCQISLTSSALATDPPPAYFPTMHSRAVRKNPKTFCLNAKNHWNAPKKGVLSVPILAIRPSTRNLQLSWFRASTEGTFHFFLFYTDIATSESASTYNTNTNIATFWLNWLRGRFSKNSKAGFGQNKTNI